MLALIWTNFRIFKFSTHKFNTKLYPKWYIFGSTYLSRKFHVAFKIRNKFSLTMSKNCGVSVLHFVNVIYEIMKVNLENLSLVHLLIWKVCNVHFFVVTGSQEALSAVPDDHQPWPVTYYLFVMVSCAWLCLSDDRNLWHIEDLSSISLRLWVDVIPRKNIRRKTTNNVIKALKGQFIWRYNSFPA